MLWFIIAAALLAGTAAPADEGSGLAPDAAAGSRGAIVSTLSAETAPEAARSDLDARIDGWIAALSAENGFAGWRDASWRKYAIGPGQHGWVVLLNAPNGGGEIGYLIVLATPNGDYQLAEYGLGDAPLFSYHTLQRALRSEEAGFTEAATVELRYAGAMHAVWKVSEGGVTRYADAKSGIWLPIDENDAAAAERNGYFLSLELEQPRKRLHRMVEAVADPYMSIAWLDVPAVSGVQDWTTFVHWLEDRRGDAIYASAAFGGKALTPLGVAGYHWWEADGSDAIRGFVALEHEGIRYVPLERLLTEGSFH